MAIRWLCRWTTLPMHFVVHAVQSPSDGISDSLAASGVVELFSEGHVGLLSHDAGHGTASAGHDTGVSLIDESDAYASDALETSAAVFAIEHHKGSTNESGCMDGGVLKTNASSFLSLDSGVDLSEVPNVAVFKKVAVKKFCKELPSKKRRVMSPQQCALLCGSDPTCRSYAVAPNADGEDDDCPMCQVFKSECRDRVSSIERCGTPTYVFQRVPFRQMGTGFFCDGDEIHVGDEPLPVCMQKCAANDECRSVTYVEPEARGGPQCRSCHIFTGKCRTGILWQMHRCHGGQATSFSKRRYCHTKSPVLN